MSKISIDLIIIFFNNKKSLNFTAPHIQELSKIFSKIILIDNGSSDLTYEGLLAIHSGTTNISAVRIEDNLQFGGALKYAMKISKSDYICWSQGDTVVGPNFYVEAIKKISKKNEQIFIKGRRYGRSTLEMAITFSLSIYASLRLKRVLYDISAFPTIIPCELKNDIILNASNDYTVELYIYWFAKLRKFNLCRIPVIYYTQENNESSWSRSLPGYCKMIKTWNAGIIRILNNEK